MNDVQFRALLAAVLVTSPEPPMWANHDELMEMADKYLRASARFENAKRQREGS